MVRIHQYINRFCICDSFEIILNHELQTFDQSQFVAFILRFGLLFLSIAVVQELQIVCTMIHHILANVFQHAFRQIHVVRKFVECHFRFNHPEFSQMA
ncbi:hypothetical protein D3C80_1334350 [compost metagenome]